VRFVKFIYEKHFQGKYDEDLSSDYAYQMLGVFLTDEMGTSIETFKMWLDHPTYKHFSGNITMIDKNDDGSLRLHYDPVMDLSEEHIEYIKRETGATSVEEEIVMSRDDFVHILDSWATCKKYCFSEIWVKRDNGVFWVEGVK
jgi:hypothetical protein